MTSIRRALLVSIVGGLLVVLLACGLVVFLVAGSSLRRQHDEALAARARTFAALVMEEYPEGSGPASEGPLVFEYTGSLDESELGIMVRVTADDGTVIAESPGWPRDAGPGPSGQQPRTVELVPGSPARQVGVSAPASRDPEEIGPDWPAASPRRVTVEVLGRTAPVERAEAALLGALGLGGLLAAVGAGAAVWVGAGRGLAPVRRLSAALDRLGPTQLTMPLRADPTPDELRPIAEAIARLLERLRAAIERERRFTDAAAHELRTPIAELRTIGDVAERWPEPERLRRAVAEARSIAAEMEALLESLLTVARGGGEARAAGTPEPVALLPLARSVADSRLEQAAARGVSWQFEGDEAARWTAPRAAVLAIVRNLIDNAAEYTPDGGSVRVSARAKGNGTSNGAGAVFEVESGPVTLAPSDTERIFEPFWRAEQSRSDRSHRGLGLSIVAALGDALRLERRVAITPGRALRITLSSQDH